MTEVLEQNDTATSAVGDEPPDVSHIVDQRANSGQDVTAAYIEGTELVALCGFRWVPSKSPEGRPVCPECLRVIESIGRSFEP